MSSDRPAEAGDPDRDPASHPRGPRRRHDAVDLDRERLAGAVRRRGQQRRRHGHDDDDAHGGQPCNPVFEATPDRIIHR